MQQSVYSPIGVPYNVLATKESVPALCKLLKMRLRDISNPPFRTKNSYQDFALLGRQYP
jgi:hypothetical protein